MSATSELSEPPGDWVDLSPPSASPPAVPAERIPQPLWYFPPRDEWPGRLWRAGLRTVARLRPLAASMVVHAVGVYLCVTAISAAFDGSPPVGGSDGGADDASASWGYVKTAAADLDQGVDGFTARPASGWCPVFPAAPAGPDRQEWPVVDAPPPAVDLTVFDLHPAPFPSDGQGAVAATLPPDDADGDSGRAGGANRAEAGAPGFAFGNAAAATDVHTVVFLCDVSFPTMNDPWPLLDALKQSVAGLRPDQSFNLIMIEGRERLVLSEVGPVPATPANKREAAKQLDGFFTGGIPDSVPPLRLAWRRKPDVVNLVTDGDFVDNNAILAEVRRLNADKSARVETTAYISAREMGDDVLGLLKTIAAENGGQFHLVREDLLNP